MNGDYQRILYDEPAEHIARVTLNRPEQHNAQDRKMLYELDSALKTAAQNDDIKVIIIAAAGDNFSSGHDLMEQGSLSDFMEQTVTLWGGFDEPGQSGQFNAEQEKFLGLCWRWRNLPKPTVVQVQGLCIAGGLMLVWPFDIVVASDDAVFSDPVVAFGLPGHEYFTHVWELGARKAREMLFCGSSFSAEECRELGMVNHVVARDELESRTLEIAQRIAKRPLIGLRMAKLAVNQSLDAQGQWNALQSTMGYHQFAHAQAKLEHGYSADPSGVELIRSEGKNKK